MDFERTNNIEIQKLDTSSVHSKYLVSYNKRHFEVTQPVAQLIEAIQKSQTILEVTTHFSLLRGQHYSEKDIASLIKEFIDPIVNNEKKNTQRTFIFRKEIIPADMIDFFSNLFKYLFHPYIIISLTFLFILLEIIFYTSTTITFTGKASNLFSLIGILLLYIFSSIFHELGHASACKYFQIKHEGIGFGLYLNFPVFYTNISNIWKLTRKKRLIVNFAGVYFQTIFLIPLFAIYSITTNEIIGYFIIAINLNFLLTLNPFFKFDGYWIITDLLGVPNLRKRTMELFPYFIQKIKGEKITSKPFLLTIQPLEKIFMIIYSLIINVFFCYYFCYVLPHFFMLFFKKFPNMFQQFILELTNGNIPHFHSWITLFSQLIIFGFSTYFIIRMSIMLYKKITTILFH